MFLKPIHYLILPENKKNLLLRNIIVLIKDKTKTLAQKVGTIESIKKFTTELIENQNIRNKNSNKVFFIDRRTSWLKISL